MDLLLSRDGNTETWQAALVVCAFELDSLIRQGILPESLTAAHKQLLATALLVDDPLIAIDQMTDVARQIEAANVTSKQVLALVLHLRNF